MKPVKFKQRVGNAIDAFFAAENLNENNLPAYRLDSIPSQSKWPDNLAEKGDLLIKVLKRACLFFPGTLILFFISFAITFNALTAPFLSRLSFSSNLLVATFYLTASFMTWYGIGDLKNSRHFVIPLSIITVGVILGIIIGMMPTNLIFIINRSGSYPFPFYFLPVALVIPVLAKGLADRKSQIKNRKSHSS